jgi:hypothetical protein
MPVAQRSEFQGRHRAPRPQGASARNRRNEFEDLCARNITWLACARSLLRRIIETIEAAE